MRPAASLDQPADKTPEATASVAGFQRTRRIRQVSMKLKPITADQFDRLTEKQVEQLQQPSRTVGDVVVTLAVSGIGGVAVGGALAVVLSATGAPGDVMLSWAGRAGLLTSCLYLAAWSLPAGKAQSLLWYRQAKRIVEQSEFRKNEAYREIISLRASHAAAMAELQTALNEALTDLRNVRMELRRTQENLNNAGIRRTTFVAKSNVEPPVVRDAQTIIRHWFDAGSWYSRPKAVQAGWSEDRHNAAVRLLNDAGLVGKSGNLRRITSDSVDEALRRLAEWRESAETAPVMPQSQSSYVEPE